MVSCKLAESTEVFYIMQYRLYMSSYRLKSPSEIWFFCKQCLIWTFEYPQAGYLPRGMDSLDNDPNNPVVREAQ